MKFEDCLMQQSDEKQKRLDLKDEVENLKSELEEEQAINKVLHRALHGPVSTHSCLSILLPPQVQGLLDELTMVEEEIIWLERKVDELKLSLYQERQLTEKWKMQRKQQRKQRHLPPCRPANLTVLNDGSHQLCRSQHYDESRKEKMKFRRASVGSAEEMFCIFSTGSTSKLLFSPSKNCP